MFLNYPNHSAINWENTRQNIVKSGSANPPLPLSQGYLIGHYNGTTNYFNFKRPNPMSGYGLTMPLYDT